MTATLDQYRNYVVSGYADVNGNENLANSALDGAVTAFVDGSQQCGIGLQLRQLSPARDHDLSAWGSDDLHVYEQSADQDGDDERALGKDYINPVSTII